MSVRLRIQGLGDYSQLALCGAAQGDDIAYAAVGFEDRQGNVWVRLAGAVTLGGATRKLAYGQGARGRLAVNAPQTLTLTLRPGVFNLRGEGKTVASYRPGPVPLPSRPGGWGFKVTDMGAVIEQVSIAL